MKNTNLEGGHIIAGDVLTILHPNGSTKQVQKSHPRFKEIMTALNSRDFDRALVLADKTLAIAKRIPADQPVSKNVRVSDGVVLYQDEPLNNSVTNRILSFIAEELPFKPVLNFLELVMQNPSYRAVNELYPWMELRNLPITEDGYCIGYKAVDGNYMDKRTHTVDNHIGQKPSMRRNLVDDNWGVACSQGFHIGSLSYGGPHGSFMSSDGHSVICKFNPADVVSVSASENKLRVCAYEVIGEATEALPDNLYPAPEKREGVVSGMVSEKSAQSRTRKGQQVNFGLSWKERVGQALDNLGRVATLVEIYNEVSPNGLSSNKKAKVRQTLAKVAKKQLSGKWKLLPNKLWK